MTVLLALYTLAVASSFAMFYVAAAATATAYAGWFAAAVVLPAIAAEIRKWRGRA